MKKQNSATIKILKDYKEYIEHSKYLEKLPSNKEGSYSFTQIDSALGRKKIKCQELEIALMKEILTNPSILEKSEELDLMKEMKALNLTCCLQVANPTPISTKKAYDQATDILATRISDIKHFFNIDKMASMGYDGDHPELIAESHQVARTLAEQDCIIGLMKLMASNPEILTIQDINGNNIGMECARLKLTVCAEVAKANAEAAVQKNELGYTIDDTIELAKPKAFRKPSLRDVDFER